VLLPRLLKQHKDDVAITRELCSTMAVIADYWRNKIEFSEAGVYDTLLVVLLLHKSQPAVLAAALRALNAIAVNKEDQLYLKECGVCDLVVELLKMYISRQDVSREACASIWSLSLNPDNHVNFLEIGTCELLWSVLQQHNKNVFVLEQLCGAMESLTRQSTDLEKWRFAFAGDNKQVLPEMLMLNATFPEVIDKLCLLIRRFIVFDEFRSILTTETYIFDVLSDCLEFHADNAKLCKNLEELRNKFVVY
jgi:hypothetical protein